MVKVWQAWLSFPSKEMEASAVLFFEGLTLNRIAKMIDLFILFLLVRLCGKT